MTTWTPHNPIRKRIQAGICPACGERPHAPRAILCAPCRATHGYCPGCERVAPLVELRRSRGDVYCRACKTQRDRQVKGRRPRPCARCEQAHYAPYGRRLCAACQQTHAWCGGCKRPLLHSRFAPAPPSRAARGVRFADYCRRCDAAHKMVQRAEPILDAIFAAFGVTERAIYGPGRARRVVEARFAAVHLMITLQGRSLAAVGRILKKDHTTVMHARRRAVELLGADPAFCARLEAARARLGEQS